VICREEHRVFQGAWVLVIDGVMDPAVLEAQGCREALQLAGDLQMQGTNQRVKSDGALWLDHQGHCSEELFS
jgi:hypothetical protein